MTRKRTPTQRGSTKRGPAKPTPRGSKKPASRSSTKPAERIALDRAAVVRAAAHLADRDGWSAVTLSQVAREVDRHVTSLYAHVESVADLKRQVGLLAIDELTDDVWRAALGRVRHDALHAIADVYLDYATKHPGRAAAMTSLAPDDPEAFVNGSRLAEPIRATFRSYGLDDGAAAAAHRVFSATVRGFAPGGTERDVRQAVALFAAALESGRWPRSDDQ